MSFTLRKIEEIAEKALLPEYQNIRKDMVSSEHPHYKFLYLLNKFFKFDTIVELGTDYGTGTAHLYDGNPTSNIYSIDIDPTNRAVQLPENVKFIVGDSQKDSHLLPEKIDLLYIDKQLTPQELEYELKEYGERSTIILIDDLNYPEWVRPIWNKVVHEKIEFSKLHFTSFGVIIRRQL